jgi:two-component system NtrC family sensor kinase
MILIIIIVSIMPMILVGGLIMVQFHQSYEEKVYAHLRELVLKHKQGIDSFLTEKLAEIRFLSDSFNFGELMDPAFLRARLSDLQTNFDGVFVDLGIVDEEGLQVAYAGPFQLENASYSEADWFKKAIRRRYFISDVFSGLRGQPHFIVTSGKKWNGIRWILRSTIDFAAFNSIVENLRIGETGFAFILNREGAFQTKPLYEVSSPSFYYTDSLPGTDEPDSLHLAERTDAAGKRIINVSALLKNGEWLLVYQQDAAEAFSDLHRTEKIAAFLFLAGSLGIIIMAVWLSRRMVNRIARADFEKERMIQQVIEAGKLASLGEMAAGIAHEINNPVAIMMEEAGWIEDLLDDEGPRKENLEEFKRALKQIKTQGIRCREITHQMLSFARKTDSTIQPVSLNDLIRDIIGLSEKRAAYAGVAIHANLGQDLPDIRASESEMQQVFLNLINNALDAMENKGGNIRISSRRKGEEIVVEVADDGPGISADHLGKVFDPFFTTKPVGKGTGLGLSICYGIIQKMGGGIDIHSTVGRGTAFKVRIPVKKGPVDELHGL